MAIPARTYHDRTKHSPESVRHDDFQLDFDNRPTPYKTYVDRPSVALPDAVRRPEEPALSAIAHPGADGASDAAVDRETLAALCYYAAGVTREIDRGGRTVGFRAAACTGALYHVDLYAVVGDVEGLDPGVYHFDPISSSLDVLREGDYRGALATASRRSGVESAPVTFVATSTWWRNAWKYRERTFRHAFWDSGTVLANLLAAARSFALPASVVCGFADDAVATLLGVSPTEEAPLELVPVGRDSAAEASPSVEPIDPETEPLSPDPVDYPAIYEAWAAGVLPDGEAARDWRERGDRPLDGRGPGDGDRTELAPVGAERASKAPLHAVVERRGSCRAYARDDLKFRKVSTVLDRAFRGVPMDARSPDGPALQFTDCYCIVNGVEGVPAGAYQYRPDAGELELLRAGECRREAGHLALDQRLGADAAASLYFLADLDAVTDALGDRGYRAAQLEAGLTAGRLYLATYAHRGLGGTGLTFYDDAVTDFFGPRATGQTPMFLYTLGRPAE